MIVKEKYVPRKKQRYTTLVTKKDKTVIRERHNLIANALDHASSAFRHLECHEVRIIDTVENTTVIIKKGYDDIN